MAKINSISDAQRGHSVDTAKKFHNGLTVRQYCRLNVLNERINRYLSDNNLLHKVSFVCSVNYLINLIKREYKALDFDSAIDRFDAKITKDMSIIVASLSVKRR